MTRLLKLLIIGIITVELVAIVLLGNRIYQKKKYNNVLGTMTIAPLNTQNLIFPDNSQLKYFYELKSRGTITADKLSWLPYQAVYTINDDGFNDRINYPIDKEKDSFRIIALGDSFTFGVYIDTPDNYAEKLEDLLNSRLNCSQPFKFEVINLGVPGYDLAYAAEHFKIKGLKYNPDLVLWLVQNDDFIRDNELIIPLAREIEREMQAKGVKDPSYENGQPYPYWWLALKATEISYGENKLISREAEWLSKFTEIYSGELILFAYPSTQPEIIDLLKNYSSLRPNTKFYYQDFPYAELPDGHPSKDGHRLMAENLFAYLKTQNIVPCK